MYNGDIVKKLLVNSFYLLVIMAVLAGVMTIAVIGLETVAPNLTSGSEARCQTHTLQPENC